jgi:uncharacterized protein YcfJ
MGIRRYAAIALLLPLVSGAAAAHGPRHVNARVIGVEPVYETFVVETPVTTCRTVVQGRALRRSGTLAIVRAPVERCTTGIRRHIESRITGYWVEYRHRGRNHRVRSAYDPGSEIRIVTRS